MAFADVFLVLTVLFIMLAFTVVVVKRPGMADGAAAATEAADGERADQDRHAEGLEVELHDGVFLGPLGRRLLPDRDDLAQDADVEAVGLGLAIDFLDVVGNPLVLLQALDPLDQRLELVGGDGGGVVLCIGHGSLLGVGGPSGIGPLGQAPAREP